MKNYSQRSSIGAVGVRLCLSAQLAVPLEFWNLKLPDFAQESGQPLTAAWLCFKLKFACQAPIAANAHVSGSIVVHRMSHIPKIYNRPSS